MINLRKTDYMGSQPVASKLLFAPPPLGSEDDLEDEAAVPLEVADETRDAGQNT